MPEEVKLKPCPFCDTIPLSASHGEGMAWEIMCEKCVTVSQYGKDEQEAAAKWNKRYEGSEGVEYDC